MNKMLHVLKDEKKKKAKKVKKIKKKKRKLRLPDRIIGLPNPDKLWHEKWHPGRNLLNIPHPYRAVLYGPPNVGKTTIIKNLLGRAYPEFEKVILIHCDSEFTQEYDVIQDIEIMDEIPRPEEWSGDVKTMVIIDDIELKQLPKDQKANLDRLFGYVSTHKNISICLTSQDAFNVPTSVRRCANLFVIWKTMDVDSLANIARKTGFRKDKFHDLFDLCQRTRDSVWIDLTDNSPAPLRLNGFDLIKTE